MNTKLEKLNKSINQTPVENLKHDKKNIPDIKKLFEVMQVIGDGLKSGKLDLHAISKVYKVNPFLLNDMKKFIEKDVYSRNKELADKFEIVASELLNNISGEHIKNTKLLQRVTSISELIKLMQLLRGNSTQNIGIDWSTRSQDDILTFLQVARANNGLTSTSDITPGGHKESEAVQGAGVNKGII